MGCVKPFADLHMHSTYSDGVLAPEQIVERAARAGICHIAVTDHDTLGGSRAACSCARTAGIEVVPGVEISTQTDGRDAHLLGYFVDLLDSGLEELFERSREARSTRACEMADKMAADGYHVSSERLLASGGTVNRTLLARMLVEDGAAASIDDAFSRLIGKTAPYYVETVYASTVEAVHLIVEAGGFPFLAHPVLYDVLDLVPSLQLEGLVGLEAFHTLQSAEESAQVISLARERGLAVSGGSDWHGDSAHGASLGSAGLDEAAFERFLRACGRA